MKEQITKLIASFGDSFQWTDKKTNKTVTNKFMINNLTDQATIDNIDKCNKLLADANMKMRISEIKPSIDPNNPTKLRERVLFAGIPNTLSNETISNLLS